MGWFTNNDDEDSQGKTPSGDSKNSRSFSSFSYNQQRTEVSCENDPDDQNMLLCVEKTYTSKVEPGGVKKEDV